MMDLVPRKEMSPALQAQEDTVPDRETLLSFLAGGYLRFGQWKKARAMFGLLHTLSPRESDYRIALGMACFHDGSPEEALAHLDETVGRRISESVQDVPVWQVLLLCKVLRANGMLNEAYAIFSYRMQVADRSGTGDDV